MHLLWPPIVACVHAIRATGAAVDVAVGMATAIAIPPSKAAVRRYTEAPSVSRTGRCPLYALDQAANASAPILGTRKHVPRIQLSEPDDHRWMLAAAANAMSQNGN
jgi:hypothetical protein